MNKNKQLSSLRISTELDEKIKKALKKINENEIDLEIKESQFRRMAYKYFSEKVIKEGLKIEM